MPLRRPDVRRLAWLLLTLALGAAGGGLFAWLGLPAPWLVGSMVAVTAAAFAGVPIAMPVPWRNTGFILLGISMGSSVTPESLAQMRAWPLSLFLLAASVAATMLAGTRYLERVHRWDPVTARFASIPGALSSVLVLAAASAADLPRVVLAQSIRIFVLVGLMPLILSISDVSSSAGVAASATNTWLEVLITLAVSGAIAAILAHLRVPAGMLLGAMLASAFLHGAGLVHGRFPSPLVIFGLVIMGAVIGARFQGTSLAVLRGTLPGAVGSVMLALVISAGFTAFGTFFLGLPFGQLWLAYAPGGVEAMAAMALTLQLDPAFVGAHHVLRIIGLNLAIAVWLGGRASRAKGMVVDGQAASAEQNDRHAGPAS